jgi:hypothetical protein
MADDTLHPTSDQPEAGREPSRGNPRGPREGREPGGFRIRLSDNEMQAARALQEAFGLRSTVAVLGFSLRTLAQQLESGQLDELVAQQRAQAGSRAPAAGRRDGERRQGREEGRGGEPARAARANPFARPSRPAPAAPEPEPEASPEAAEAGSEDGTETALDPTIEAAASSEAPLSEATAAEGAAPEATATSEA